MTRINQENLERTLIAINEAAQSLGMGDRFTISGAYGGWRLERVPPGEDYGVEDVVGFGYGTRKETWTRMQCFLSGLRAAQKRGD